MRRSSVLEWFRLNIFKIIIIQYYQQSLVFGVIKLRKRGIESKVELPELLRIKRGRYYYVDTLGYKFL